MTIEEIYEELGKIHDEMEIDRKDWISRWNSQPGVYHFDDDDYWPALCGVVQSKIEALMQNIGREI